MITKLLDSKLLKALWISGPISTIVACSVIGLGGGGTFNDPVPTGSISAQGSFGTALVSGKTVTGAVAIYSTGGGSYTIHLENISVTADSGLQVVANASDGETFTFSLKGYYGTQNYVATLSESGGGWSSVSIKNPSLPATQGTGNIYATAILTSS